jgi:hypothetical protein
MAQIDILTRADLKALAVVGGGLEVLDWKLYDTLPVVNAGTQTVFKFFQEAVGPGGVTPETTNMDLPGQLSNGYRFAIESLGIEPILPMTAGVPQLTRVSVQDQMCLVHRGTCILWIGGRDYFRAPVSDLIGGGFQGFAQGDAGAAGAGVVYVAPRNNTRSGHLEYKFVIPSTFQFSVEVDYYAGPPAVSQTVGLRAFLKGKLIRPRQG